MRNTALFVLTSVVLGMGAAQASDDHHDRDEFRRTRLECRFQGGEALGKGKGIIHFCSALAHVCRFRGDDDGFIGTLADLPGAPGAPVTPAAPGTTPTVGGGHDDHHDRDRRRCHDRLLVACDDHVIYEDGVLRTTFLGYEFLSGVAGNPVLKIPDERERFRDDEFDDHDRRRERRSFVVPSWLKVGFGELEGICEVDRLRRDRDDDHPIELK